MLLTCVISQYTIITIFILRLQISSQLINTTLRAGHERMAPDSYSCDILIFRNPRYVQTNLPENPNRNSTHRYRNSESHNTNTKHYRQNHPKSSSYTLHTKEVTDKIKQMIKTKNQARKLWQTTKNPDFRIHKNKISKRIQYEINVLKKK